MPFVERGRSRRLRAELPEIATEPSARRVYRAMLDVQVAPMLESWGFVREADAFRWPSEVWHLGLGFAPLAWGTVGALRFDVHVLAVPREAWAQWRGLEAGLPETPDPTVYVPRDVASVGGVRARLRELLGTPDLRWSVHAGADPTQVAAEVLTGVQRRVLPAFAGRSEVPRIAS